MEVIVISDAKLKIMLTEEDLRRYEICAAAADSDDPRARRQLRELLSEVKVQCGFDTVGERVLLQLYPSRGGGAELFVTKLGYGLRDHPRSPIRSDLRPAIFRFGEMGDLLRVCRQLSAVGYTAMSAAYLSDDGTLSLVLQEKSGASPGALAFVEEYGTRRPSGSELSHLKEHSVCLAEKDAVGRLAPFAI
jgi:negative regulator of genetic competence, sporulation and motility